MSFRPALFGLAVLSLSACTDGEGNTLRQTPAPELTSAPTLSFEPSVDLGGVPWGREGAVLSITLDVDAPEGFDEAASAVFFTGVPLEQADDRVWSRTLDGTEGSGLKALDVVLVDDLGQQTRLSFDGEDSDGSGDAVRVGFDFNGPQADCVISPRESNGQQGVKVSVFANEALEDWPVLSLSEPDLTVTQATGAAGGREFTWDVGFPANTNYASWSFTAAATDRVGNAQAGDDAGTTLCSVAPEGSRFAQGLTASDVTLTVTGTNVDGETVGADARLEVAFNVSGGTLDANASTVQMGDIALAYDAANDVWFDVIGPGDADGPKTLAMTLFDTVGNRTVVRDAAKKVVVDQTAPSATCIVGPQPANASSTVAFAVQPTEPLASAPTVSSTAVAIDTPALDGARWVATVTPAPDADVAFTVDLSLTDRVGNTASGDDVCQEADRSGLIAGKAPTPDGDVVLIVSPSLPDGEGTPRARAGAIVLVTIPTDDTIDPDASFVSLSGIVLDSTDGVTWSAVLQGDEGDGRKALVATLVDVDGNVLDAGDSSVAFVADFTPPAVASAVLQRTPFLSSADDGSGRVWFTTQDPLTRQTVSASLRVGATEDLGAPVQLSVDGPATLGWGDPASQTARLATWALPSVPDGPDGDHTFTVLLEDEVGNVSEPLALDVVFALDTEGPAEAPDVDTPDRIVFDRQPWGSASVGGLAPSFAVRGAAGAAAPATLVVLENASGGQLASAVSDADGGFRVAFGADAPEVFVRTHDDAGNPSPRAGVRDVSWTATLAGKVDGSTRENPHAFVRLATAGETLTPAPFADAQERAQLPEATVVAPPWLPWDGNGATAEEPPARGDHALAYDAARGVTVLFGGFGAAVGSCGTTGRSECGDTWESDGGMWTEVSPATSPPTRVDHALVYDASRGVTVLFGGSAAIRTCGEPDTFACSDTWTWDGTTWKEVTPVHSPPARRGHALAYDAVRGVVVLFGGEGAAVGACGTADSALCSDTWEWDGAAWTEIAPVTGPPARGRHALAYDVARGVTVLFGGQGKANGSCGTPGGLWCSDTWEWDGTTWTEVSDAGSPPARRDHALAYDAARGVIVLFGGEGVCATWPFTDLFCSGTWVWDGTAWTEVETSTSPPLRRDHALAYDTELGVVLLFGGTGSASGACGESNSFRCADTWSWDGTTWTEVSPATSPPNRVDHALAYDAARGVTVGFGGIGAGLDACHVTDGSAVCSDTWVWDGHTWTPRSPVVSPPARYGHSLAYDAVRRRVVLFGGQGVVDGACGTLGEGACSDTWQWDGMTWSEASPSTPPPARAFHALGFDTARGVAVLFGGEGTAEGACGSPGSDLCSDTWSWDGATWTEVFPVSSPPARRMHALAYDAARGVTVLFGGLGDGPGACGTPGSDLCSDTWEWDGSTWTEVTPSISPSARGRHALAYDAARGVTVLFGGTGAGAGACGTVGSASCSDTWLWDGSTWTEATYVNSPPSRHRHALSYDIERRVALLFGGAGSSVDVCGASGSTACSDTWLLPSDSELSPRHDFTLSFAPALAAAAPVRTITARWVAGGSGTPGGTRESGAELIVWSGVSWTVLDSHTADEDNAAELCARLVADPAAPPDPGCADLVDPALVRNLFRFGPDLTSTFAVRPTAPIGTDEGALRSEDVAVTVRYRLPPED